MKKPSRHILLPTLFTLAVASTLLACSVQRGPEEPGEAVIELSDIADGTGGFVINGSEDLDGMFSSIARVGDINGDGLEDIAVCDNFVNLAEQGYVLFGKKDAAPVELSGIADGIGGFVIKTEEGDRAGFGPSAAGDVNGDGLDDLLFRTYDRIPLTMNNEINYVIFGKPSGNAVELSSIDGGIGGFTIKATEISVKTYSDQLFFYPAGDLNGDGLGDLVAGLREASPNGVERAGSTYVVFGKTSGTPVRLSEIIKDSDAGGFVIHGVREWDQSEGRRSAGDVNGDGLSDLFVHTNGSFAGGEDRTFVIFGKKTGTTIKLTSVPSDGDEAGFVINGSGSARSAGDVNGDGLDDIILDKNWNQRGTMYEFYGETYVVFGKVSSTAVDLEEIAMNDNTGGFRINQTEGQWKGRMTTGAGDVNGDGLDDLIVEDVQSSQGHRYVVFGKTSGTAVELPEIAMDDNAGGFRIDYNDPFRQINSIRSAGHVNGDELADLAIDVWNFDANKKLFVGATYIVFGKASGTAVALSNVAKGTGGFCLLSVDIPESNTDPRNRIVWRTGDVNGDGLEDFISKDPYSRKGHVLFSPFPAPKPSQ